MESLENKIKKFLSINYDCGSDDGFNDDPGYGSGYGAGNGCCFGYGAGDGEQYGYGYGYGSGNGHGFDNGSGYGYGSSSIKSYNHQKVYYIDYIPTIIESVRDNVARGYIINSNKTLTSCYVIKVGNNFAHGETLKAARADAFEKRMQDATEEERVEMFISKHPNLDDKYPCEDLFKWHNIITGSCEMGRRQFCKDHNIDLKAMYTVRFFLDITKHAYGGNVIKKVIEEYESKNK